MRKTVTALRTELPRFAESETKLTLEKKVKGEEIADQDVALSTEQRQRLDKSHLKFFNASTYSGAMRDNFISWMSTLFGT